MLLCKIRGGSSISHRGRQLIILPIFPENCMKMKKIGPRRGHIQNFSIYYSRSATENVTLLPSLAQYFFQILTKAWL